MILGLRRVRHDLVGDLAVIDHVGPLLHLHRSYRGHGLYSPNIDLAELLDERQHGIQLALKVRNLGFSDRNPREMRDTANSGGIDGHYIGPQTAIFRPPYS